VHAADASSAIHRYGVPPGTASSEPWPSPAKSWYAVALFGLTVFTLFGNGFLVALMLEPIKHDLQLSDQQVALIFGLVGQFTLAFASLAISPLADKYSRTLIIGLGLLILGGCNIGSALVATAGALMVVRLIGGVGGAGNGPATFSLLADLFPPAKLPTAMATMNIGFMVAVGLSYLVGGYLLRSARHAGIHAARVRLDAFMAGGVPDHGGFRTCCWASWSSSRCTRPSGADVQYRQPV
jgi:MFS family permease